MHGSAMFWTGMGKQLLWFAAIVLMMFTVGCPEPAGDDDGTVSPSPVLTDLDEDGYTGTADGGDDCDDQDPSIHPGAEEVCDGVDNDCDGDVDEEVLLVFYPDQDGDGFGDTDQSLEACNAPEGHVDLPGDCDDTAASVNPSAEEVCDGVDNDCDDQTDEEVSTRFYQDADSDGHGDAEVFTQACEPPPGYVDTEDDCDDGDAHVYPGASEVCNGVDDDCDGDVDEDVLLHLFVDQDGDGYGDSDQPVETCDSSGSVAEVGGDCDDQDPLTHPDAGELCDGVDNDCDGEVDEELVTELYADTDGDGHGDPNVTVSGCDAMEGYTTSSDDCDDSLAEVHPGAEEVCDGVDNDCDGTVDEDLDVAWYQDTDGDGVGGGDPELSCMQPEGYVQEGGDCDDSLAEVYPGAEEVCDGLDNDCDGTVDGPDEEGNPPVGASTWYLDEDGDGYGDTGSATDACDAPTGHVAAAGDCDDTDPAAYPGGEEVCDGADNDCDGQVDNNALDVSIWYADQDEDGFGTPDVWVEACDPPTGYVDNDDDCDDGSAAVSPQAVEVTDGVDNDCDGVVDNGTPIYDDDGDGYTEEEGDCDDTDPTTYPGAAEVEDGADNDCDGTVDEGTAAYDDDGDGYTENEGDCDDGDPDVLPGQEFCPWETSGESCAAVLYAGESNGDGFYELDLDGTGSPSAVYCDMTTDGGGWTLLGTISGADADHWNTEDGLWSNEEVLGRPDHALDRDYKSDAWFRLSIARSEVLVRRSYRAYVQAEVVLDRTCTMGKSRFKDLFDEFDTRLACTPDHIRILRSSPVGVAAGFREGKGEGLGADGTNGFCWNGEDTRSNGFRGRLVWNAFPDTDCNQAGHSGGLAVFWENNNSMTSADVTGTDWLAGTNYDDVVVSLFVRSLRPDDVDGDGYTPAEGDCNDTDSTVYPGTVSCPWELGGSDCSEILYAGDSQGDGVYRVQASDGTTHEVYCDMTTDGGGWTLVGTIAGGDEDRWNTEQGLWVDDQTIGTLGDPFSRDYKSVAWSDLDISGGEVLYQRRYDGKLRGAAILSSPCLGAHSRFSDLFSSFDTSLACTPDDIRVLATSATGVASSSYAEGAISGLGGTNTNGLCWNGEDTSGNVFKGRLVWNTVAGADCSQASHVGGIAVFWENDVQYTVADITGTNWLYGTNYAKTAISLYVRLPNRDDVDGDGYSPEGGDCDDADPAVYPGTMDCVIDVGGSSCDDILWSGDALGDGIYRIYPEGGVDSYEVYCDMTTDGGGWTLMGTISGADEDRWATETGYWADDNVLGSLENPFGLDYKSRAWSDLEVGGGELLWQRRYAGEVEGLAVLGNRCLESVAWLPEAFDTFDRSRVCEPEDIRVLFSSATGVYDATYAEGASAGLGGSGTNGFCWNGEDTESNVFKGHLFWNQYPGTDCDQQGHLGGVGVFWEDSSQYTVADITGTNWVYGLDFSQIAISLYARASTRRTNPFDWDMDGFSEAEGDCDDTSNQVYPGTFACPGDFGASSCLEILAEGNSVGDGIYIIDLDGDGPQEPFRVYCDMTTDGGGWTLLGTISGGDANQWAEMVGYWGNEDELGSLVYPFTQDFKSPAWYLMDITGGEILYVRRYQDVIRGKAVLTTPCLGDKETFNQFFEIFDTSLACHPGDIRVLQASSTGVNDSSYAEGASYGLGGSGTNGFCWNGEDTESNVFKGHFFWNQYPGTSNCSQGGHLGGIGVFWENSSQYTVADITGANWLYGTDYSETDISLFLR